MKDVEVNRARLRKAIEDLDDEEVYELLFAATRFDPSSLSPRVAAVLRRAQVNDRNYLCISDGTGPQL